MSGGFGNKNTTGSGFTASEVLWVQTGNAGVLLLPEGAAPSATPGVGKVYVKSSDSLLYFKDDAGTEYSLTGSSPETATTIGALIGGAGDATPNDTDFVATSLTAAGILKKITWTNVKAFLKTYFDTLYASVTAPTFGTSITGSYLTASEMLITGASKEIISAPVATYPSLTELTYVKGVSSAIQTQLGTKAPSTSPTFATSVTGSYLTASEMLITGASKEIISAPVATYPSLTELTYVKGVTSAIQTQLGAKAPLDSPVFTTAVTLPVGLTGVIRADSGVVSVDTDVTDIVSAASDTVAGKIELATDAEMTTGTATDRAITPANAKVELDKKLALAGGTMTGNITLGENTSIDLDPAGSADGKYSGICITGTAGAALAFGDIIYLAVADSRWELADATAAATGVGMLGVCVLAAAGDASATKILLQGTIRADTAFPALTIAAPVYLDDVAGDVSVAVPTGADTVIRCLGFALTADEMYFNPSQDVQITVA